MTDKDLHDDYKGAGFSGRLGFGTRPALLVIDFAKAYLDRSSPLYAGVEGTLESTCRVLEAARSSGIPCIFTRVVFEQGPFDGGIFYRKVPSLWVFDSTCAFGQLADELVPGPDELVVSKQYASAFFGTSLASTLTASGVDSVVLTGLTTSGCVRATGVDAMQHGFIPIVVEEAVGDRDERPHRANLFDLGAKYADVVHEDEVIDHLKNLSRVTLRIQIVDVAPRDGLQSEAMVMPTGTKVELIERLVDAGVRRVEAVSFAHPERVPQMADAEAVMDALARRDDVSYAGLVLNERGVDRAVASRVDEINAVVVATDTFSARNQNTTTEGALAAWAAIAAKAAVAGIPASVTIAASFGCPYEGEVPVERLTEVAARAAEAAPSELVLADTIGVAVPRDVVERVSAVRAVVGDVPLRCHFHNTRNTGMANAYAAVEAGIDVLDASLGGIGGCPFAPRAVGNIPTEDLVYMLERAGVETDISLQKLINAAEWLGEQLGRGVPGLLWRAGPFPAPGG